MKTIRVVAAVIKATNEKGDPMIFATQRGYGDFKLAVGELCADTLTPVQEEYKRLMADKGYLESVMRMGAERASHAARRTLAKVKRKMGFTELPR